MAALCARLDGFEDAGLAQPVVAADFCQGAAWGHLEFFEAQDVVDANVCDFHFGQSLVALLN